MQMSTQEVWDLVLQNERLLRREVRRLLPRERREELDELYHEVVLGKAHQIMRTYDATKGAKPITHLCVNCRWYAFKWVHRHENKPKREPLNAASDEGYHEAPHHGVDVEHHLERIPEQLAKVLDWTHRGGYTPVEIAEHLGCAVKDVKQMLDDATELAQDYAGVAS